MLFRSRTHNLVSVEGELLRESISMKKIVWMSLVVGVISILSQSVYAEGRWHKSTIKRVYPIANGGFVITFVKDSSFCLAEGPEKFHYFRVGQNNMTKEGLDKMYDLAIASAALGKVVGIYFDDESLFCDVNRMYAEFDEAPSEQ